MTKIKKLIITLFFFGLIPFMGLAQEFDRDIETTKFVPKGQWLFGGAFSYSQTSSESYKFLIFNNINGNTYTFKVSPYFGYFIKDNLCLGARFSYKRNMLRLDDFEFDLGDDFDIDLNIKDYYTLNQVYSAALIMRNYISLGNSKRFGIFNEVRLGAGGGQGKIISGKGASLTGTFQEIFELELGVTPGILAFITNNVAVEASVNVMGFSYNRYKQTTDQIYTGVLENSNVNFKIDIFSINIGVSFYIPYLNPLRRKNK